jgi:hypothetical protein
MEKITVAILSNKTINTPKIVNILINVTDDDWNLGETLIKMLTIFVVSIVLFFLL